MSTAKTYHAATTTPQGNYRTVTSSDHTSKASFAHELRMNGFRVAHVWSEEQYADVIAHGPNAEMTRSEYSAAELAQGYYHEVVLPRLREQTETAFTAAKAQALDDIRSLESATRSIRATNPRSDVYTGKLAGLNEAYVIIANTTSRDGFAAASNELANLAIHCLEHARIANGAGDNGAERYFVGAKSGAEDARLVVLRAYNHSGPQPEVTHYAITTSWSRGPQLHECAGFPNIRSIESHLRAKGLRVSEVMTAAKWADKRQTLPASYVEDLERESVPEVGELVSLGRVTCAVCGDFADGPEAIEACGRSYCCEECAEDDDVVRCEHCGKWVDLHDLKTTVRTEDGSAFCGHECARARGYEQCDFCGKWYEVGDSDAVECCGHSFCSLDCAHDMGFEQCYCCGEWHEAGYGDSAYIEDEGFFCSSHCAEQYGFRQCQDCGEWIDEDEAYYTADDRVICENCTDDYYYCSDCEELFPEDEIHYCESDGRYYCDRCIGDHDDDELEAA